MVDDGSAAETGQMSVGEFLDRLRPELAAAIDTELADIGMTAQDCPYLDFWIERYRARRAADVTELVRRYAGPTSMTPAEMIIAVRRRVVLGARAYRGGTASVTPNTAPTKLRRGGVTGLIPSARDALRLGEGTPMDGGTRARMERAYRTDLSHVRFHSDPTAGELSQRLGARAVTLGDHIAFDHGELSRSGIERDVLIAHEIAHSLQQRGANEPAGGAPSTAFERDADRSAALVAIRMLLGEKAAVAPSPRLRGGLALGRCVAAAPAAAGAVGGTGAGISITTILGAIGLGGLAVGLESDTPRVEEEEEVRTCETVYPGVRECWTLPLEYVFTSPAMALAGMKAALNDPSLVLHNPSVTTSGPCPGAGTHYNVRSGSQQVGSITCCPCCSDDPGGPVMTTRCRIV